MTDVNLTLVIISSSLLACGVYLLLERSLSRVLVGLVMMGNGVSIAFLVAGGPTGDPPIAGRGDTADMADPLPQAMVLTAIVITLATTAFVLAMAYRSWQLNGHDDVQDDAEDALIRRLATMDVTSDSYDASSDEGDPDQELASDFAEGELAAEQAEQAEQADQADGEQETRT
ncbi:Na(+)/H(+) antiporter subunit C [Nocardioides houyundeii]|uniref:Na(+)/H(+) antiporter subunit C n=1 Tax=Nocardioides houyundeii TaxID=2045452 RepID=UPI000DF2C5C3|nr:Na(+)/H(+) antiporter subunit C [Nocardioides houyundeii]